MEHLQYPNESKEYRAARNALLDAEIELRAQIEAVAAKRRALPLGGELKELLSRENYLSVITCSCSDAIGMLTSHTSPAGSKIKRASP